MGNHKITYILVHGAWHGSWCWKRVCAELQSSGHNVFTPTLTGLGERSHLNSAAVDLSTHIADIVNLIQWEELSDVILCGHSYLLCWLFGKAHLCPALIEKAFPHYLRHCGDLEWGGNIGRIIRADVRFIVLDTTPHWHGEGFGTGLKLRFHNAVVDCNATLKQRCRSKAVLDDVRGECFRDDYICDSYWHGLTSNQNLGLIDSGFADWLRPARDCEGVYMLRVSDWTRETLAQMGSACKPVCFKVHLRTAVDGQAISNHTVSVAKEDIA